MPEIRRSATEAQLLALLTSTPGQEFHTRELVRRVGRLPRSVHLALEKLERQGLIASRRLGPLRLWRMEPSHPLYRSLREMYARTIGVGARLRQVIETKPGAEIAFIFGSYARGDDDPTSDIDVFVLGEPDWAPLEDESRKLLDELGREVNFVAWRLNDLERAVKGRSPFLDTLQRSEKIWIRGDDREFERLISGVEREVRGRRPAARRRTERARKEARARAAEPGTRTRRAAKR
ncbi:MAG TPA: nucleotidyltransferase domain-containing protein [Candidatus Limnocylindria bacterium]